MQKQQSSGGTKKHGRNQGKCARYRAEGRREKNKARKMAKRQRKLDKAKKRRQARYNLPPFKLAAGKTAGEGKGNAPEQPKRPEQVRALYDIDPMEI